MKKIAATMASLAAALTLTGCAEEGPRDLGAAPKTTATPATSAPPHPTTETMQTPAYEDDIDAKDIMEAALLREGINLPPGLAAEYADAVCTDLEDGFTPMGIAFTAHKHLPMYDIVQHGMMVGASVGSFCPEYGYLIEQMGE